MNPSRMFWHFSDDCVLRLELMIMACGTDGRTDNWSDSLTARKAAGVTPWRHVSVGVSVGEEEETSATCYCAQSITPSDLLGKSKILNGENVTHLVKILLGKSLNEYIIGILWENKPNLAEMCGMSSVVAWGDQAPLSVMAADTCAAFARRQKGEQAVCGGGCSLFFFFLALS